MKILKVDQEKPEKDIILEAVKFLRQGKILIHPTETCYGFAVDIFNQSALNLLYQAKNMPNSKPVSMMVRNLEEAKKYAEFDSSALRLAGEFWPGPLTLVLPRKKSLPSFFNEGHNTVGIRCPDSLLVQKLLEDFDGPLSTTSANLSGQPEAYNVDDFLLQIQGRSHVESGDIAVKDFLILDGGQIAKNPPSTIVGFENGQVVILRKGSFAEEVAKFLKKPLR